MIPLNQVLEDHQGGDLELKVATVMEIIHTHHQIEPEGEGNFYQTNGIPHGVIQTQTGVVGYLRDSQRVTKNGQTHMVNRLLFIYNNGLNHPEVMAALLKTASEEGKPVMIEGRVVNEGMPNGIGFEIARVTYQNGDYDLDVRVRYFGD